VKNYEAPHCITFLGHLLPLLSWLRMFFSVPCSLRSFSESETEFHTHVKQEVMIQFTSIFKFLITTPKDKISAPNCSKHFRNFTLSSLKIYTNSVLTSQKTCSVSNTNTKGSMLFTNISFTERTITNTQTLCGEKVEFLSFPVLELLHVPKRRSFRVLCRKETYSEECQ
jgi:hypothetical protein